MKERVKRVLGIICLLIILAIIYVIWVNTTDLAIPCVFRTITGLKCPGCGNTTAALAIADFDFIGAFNANYFFYPTMAYILWIISVSTIRYIRHGYYKVDVEPKFIHIVFLVLLIAWGIVRNIYGL